MEATDPLLNIQSAMLQHGLKLRLLAKIIPNDLLVNIIGNGFFVLVGEEGCEVLVPRKLRPAGIESVPGPSRRCIKNI